MKTIIHNQIYEILRLFYINRNKPLHLRDISRQIKLNESPTTRHLNYLAKNNILKHLEDGNMKKFYINPSLTKQVYTIFDMEKFESLPLLRKNAIRQYIAKLKEKPVFVVLFGSTAKGAAKKESDIDIIEVFNTKTNTKEARDYAEAMTGMHISAFQLVYPDFVREIKLKQDHVIQSGIETGFPVYNHYYYYEVLENERG